MLVGISALLVCCAFVVLCGSRPLELDESTNIAEENIIRAMDHVGSDSPLLPHSGTEADVDYFAPASDLDRTQDRISRSMGRIGRASPLLQAEDTVATSHHADASNTAGSRLLRFARGLISTEVRTTKQWNLIRNGVYLTQQKKKSPPPLEEVQDEGGSSSGIPLPPSAGSSSAESGGEEEEEESSSAPASSSEGGESSDASSSAPVESSAGGKVVAKVAPSSSGGAVASSSAESSEDTPPPPPPAPPLATTAAAAEVVEEDGDVDVGGFLAGASYDETARARYILVTMIGLLFVFGAYLTARRAGFR